MLIFVRCELIENRLLTINLGCDEKCILFSTIYTYNTQYDVPNQYIVINL